MKKYRVGYTTGVFDLFHIGHLNILRNAKSFCDYLIVGVSTDDLVRKEKNKTPVIPFEERKQIVESIKYVDMVVPQENKNKLEAYGKYHFNAMFVGSDWEGTPQWKQFEKDISVNAYKIIAEVWNAKVAASRFFNICEQLLKGETDCGYTDGPCSKADNIR